MSYIRSAQQKMQPIKHAQINYVYSKQ